MHALSEFLLQLFQFSLHLLSHRLPQHGELPFSGFAAYVRETKKVKGLRLAVAPRFSIFSCEAAEFYDARFVGVQFQVEAPEALHQLPLKLLGIGATLESDNNIVGKTHDDNFSVPFLPPPLVGPKVEHVMQIDVRQQWGDASPLGRSLLCPRQLSIFQHARVQPFSDVAYDALVRDSVLDELDQPFV
jgi:hypothetical protein